MNIIKNLMLKDFYEYKNNFIKVFGTVVLIVCIPIFLFNFGGISTAIFRDTDMFSTIIVIFFITLILGETALFPMSRDIKSGMFEKYFINIYIKPRYIYMSKFNVNIIIIGIAFVLMMVLNFIVSRYATSNFRFSVNLIMIYQLVIACSIGTSASFICSLVNRDDNNAMAYAGFLLLIYMGYYKLLDVLRISNKIIENLGITIIAFLLLMIVLHLLRNNKFIRKS
ncbi:MAG: hypothetical protein ACK5KR_02475 [Breznakia sp.]